MGVDDKEYLRKRIKAVTGVDFNSNRQLTRLACKLTGMTVCVERIFLGCNFLSLFLFFASCFEFKQHKRFSGVKQGHRVLLSPEQNLVISWAFWWQKCYVFA